MYFCSKGNCCGIPCQTRRVLLFNLSASPEFCQQRVLESQEDDMWMHPVDIWATAIREVRVIYLLYDQEGKTWIHILGFTWYLRLVLFWSKNRVSGDENGFLPQQVRDTHGRNHRTDDDCITRCFLTIGVLGSPESRTRDTSWTKK